MSTPTIIVPTGKVTENGQVITSSTINQYNILNIVAYIGNVLVVFGIGQFGWLNRPSNGVLSDKYQTIITPSGGTFSIWGIIFVLQLIWCLWQFVPKQRTSPGVLAVHYNYIGVCIMQMLWTFAFSYEIIWLSLLCMYGILFFLVQIHVSLQNYIKVWKGYILWQLPFSIHLGWIIAASLVNTNVLVVNYTPNAFVQYIVAIVSLSLVIVTAILFLIQYPVDLTPPIVLLWAVWGIVAELDIPKEQIINTFTINQIDTISAIAFGVLCGVGSLLLLKIVYVVVVQRHRDFTSDDTIPNRLGIDNNSEEEDDSYNNMHD